MADSDLYNELDTKMKLIISEMTKDGGRHTLSDPPPSSSEDCYESGIAYLEMMKSQDALDDLISSLTQRPPIIHVALSGWATLRMNQRAVFDQAISDLKEAIRLGCTKHNVKKKLAEAYFLRGSFKCVFAKVYVRMHTHGVVNSIKDRFNNRGKASFDIVFDSGIEDFSRALQADPENFELRMKIDKVKKLRDRSIALVMD